MPRFVKYSNFYTKFPYSNTKDKIIAVKDKNNSISVYAKNISNVGVNTISTNIFTILTMPFIYIQHKIY